MPTTARRSTDLAALAAAAPAASVSVLSRRDALLRLWLVPAASGALTAAAFIDFRLHFLAWIAFVPLLLALARTQTMREAVTAGFAAGLATNVPAFYWLVYTMRVFGGFPYPIALLFYLCLSVYAAVQIVLFAAAVRALGMGVLGLCVPVFWVALEFLYPNLFPWRMANTQFHLPVLIQIGDLTGPFGLSFVILWVNAAIAIALGRPRRLLPLAAAAAALGLVCAYGAWRMPVVEAAVAAAPVVRVGLVQGNVGIREKGDAAYFEVNIDRYRRLSKPLEPRVDVLVWPESVAQWWVPADALRLDVESNPFPDLKTYLVFGGLAYSQSGGKVRKYNSAFLIDSAARVLGRYDKRVLLPFGEYLPGASIFPSLAELSPHSGDFSPGERFTTLDVPDRVRLAPLICYEDVPSGIARAMTRGGAEALLTIFNDAWFGPTIAPYQHEALALWRAIENRRYFLRVGNAGTTGVIDPLGRVVDRLGLFTEETLVAEIRPLRISTFYTRWGDAFAWSIVVVAGVLFIRPGTRRALQGRATRAVV
jgi:apolipoprotein N-acyltransferase